MPGSPINPVKIFFSYSHKDKHLRDKLEEQLSLLKNQGLVSTWHDRKIFAGDEFDKEISEHLDEADLILLLVSPSFIASKYCYEKEMKRALEKHEAKEARVVPVILRPCDWQTAPFGKLNALPEEGRPVTTWQNRDKAFLDVAQGIRKYIEEKTTSSGENSAFSEEDAHKRAKHFLELPTSVVGFVPRQYKEGEDFVQSLVTELNAVETEILVLWGAGGVGKTTLAAQVARNLQSEKKVIWINADNRVDVSVGSLLDDIADSLDYPEFRQYPPEKKRKQVLYILREGPSVVILDNFETISLESQIECLEFLKLPGFVSLITTRDRIDGAKNRQVDEMLESEAQEFLSRLIEDSALPQAFTKEVRSKIIEIAERNPLIMQWITGQIDLAQKPEDVFEELSHGEGEAAQRVFNRSFNLPQLGDDGRRILLAHSLFTQEARRKSIREIAGFSDNKRFNEAIKKISSLRLINVTEGSERLLLQGLTRQLARAEMEKKPNAKTYRQRFVKYFTVFSTAHEKPTAENLKMQEEDKNNILAAIDLAFELNDSESVFQLVQNCTEFLHLRGDWEESIHFTTRALNLAINLNEAYPIGQFSNALAKTYYVLGDLKKADELYQESLKIGEKFGYRQGIAATLGNLGAIAYDRGDFEKAEELYKKNLEISEKLGDQRGIASSHNNLGAIAHDRGELEKAEELYQKSLELKETQGDRQGIAASLGNLGTIAQDRGELEKAEELHQKSLEINEKLGNRQGIAASLGNLGNIARGRGELEKAEELHQRSLELKEKLGNRRGIAASLGSLGNIARDRGKLEKAEELHQGSLEINEKLGNRYGVAISFLNLGEIYLEKESLQQAESFCNKSLQICQEIGAKESIAENKLLLGKIKNKSEDLDEAKNLLQECLEIFQHYGFTSGTAKALWEYGLLWEKKKELTKALDFLKESLSIFEKLESPKAEKVHNDIQRVENNSQN